MSQTITPALAIAFVKHIATTRPEANAQANADLVYEAMDKEGGIAVLQRLAAFAAADDAKFNGVDMATSFYASAFKTAFELGREYATWATPMRLQQMARLDSLAPMDLVRESIDIADGLRKLGMTAEADEVERCAASYLAVLPPTGGEAA